MMEKRKANSSVTREREVRLLFTVMILQMPKTLKDGDTLEVRDEAVWSARNPRWVGGVVVPYLLLW